MQTAGAYHRLQRRRMRMLPSHPYSTKKARSQLGDEQATLTARAVAPSVTVVLSSLGEIQAALGTERPRSVFVRIDDHFDCMPATVSTLASEATMSLPSVRARSSAHGVESTRMCPGT